MTYGRCSGADSSKASACAFEQLLYAYAALWVAERPPLLLLVCSVRSSFLRTT